MPDEDAAFGARLDLALKLLNISRGTLAAEARVDKSLVSRWLRGLVAPRGHNLVALTQSVRSRAPGFSQISWDLPTDAFVAALGGSAAAVPVTTPKPPMPVASPDRGAPGLSASRLQSIAEVQREGHAYPGVYVAFRLAFRNTGEVLGDLIVVWREGARLLFRQFDPLFSHGGEVLVLRHQLFFIGEDDQRVDGLTMYLLNGVTGQKAIRFDGLNMTVLNDRDRTPGATPVVFQRLADLAGPDTPPPDAALAAVREKLAAAFGAGTIIQLAGREIDQAIRPRIGVPAADGRFDHLLLVPADRSLCASDMDWTDSLAAAVTGLRAALVEDRLALPMSILGADIDPAVSPAKTPVRLVASRT